MLGGVGRVPGDGHPYPISVQFLVKMLNPASFGIRTIEDPVICGPKFILKRIRVFTYSPVIDACGISTVVDFR